jgi:rhodanese-related sulfurtransferase
MKIRERDITSVLTVIANMVEDFSHLSEKELANSPVIYFPKNRIKLGEFKLHETKIVELQFENKGKKDLKVHNIEINNTLFKVELQFENKGKKDLKVHNIEINNTLFKLQNFDSIIKPGDKGKIVISIKPIQTTNNMKSNITVISNDPKHSSVTLIAQGSIKKNILRPKIEKTDINEKDAYYIFKEFKGKEELIILDIRSEEEFENNHIPDAINIDFYNKNFYRILKLLDKSKIYLVYCKSGMLSEEAVMMMKELDFERVHNMEKGIIGWEKSGYPLMK